MNQTCTKCTVQNKPVKKFQASFWSTLLIILIPKCPMCVMAYSSVITVCGGKSIYTAQNNWISFIPMVLSVLILFLLIKNYKDTRTVIAISLAAVGSLMLILVHQLVLTPDFYNPGAFLLFFSVWLNGSFLSFVSNVKSWIKNRMITWHT